MQRLLLAKHGRYGQALVQLFNLTGSSPLIKPGGWTFSREARFTSRFGILEALVDPVGALAGGFRFASKYARIHHK
jgi:hypothetical protein